MRVQNSSISPPKNDYAATEPSNPPVIIEICTRFFTSLFEPFTRDALPFARSQFQEIKNEGPWAYTSKICIAFTKAVKEQPLDTAYYATGAIAHLAGANPMMEGAFAAVHFCKKARDLSNLQMPFSEPGTLHLSLKLGIAYLLASSLPLAGAQLLEPLTYEQNCPQELMSKMNTVYACISSGHKPSTCAHGASETPILISTLTRHSPTPEGFYPSSLIETDRFATCITQAFAPHPGNISSSQTPAAVQICFQNLDERTLRVVASSIVTPYPPSEIGTTLVVIKLFQHNTSCRSLYQPPQAKLGPDTDCIFTSVRDPHIPPNQFCFDPNMNQATLTTSNRHMGKNEKKPVSILVRNAQSMGVDINNDGQSSVQTPPPPTQEATSFSL